MERLKQIILVMASAAIGAALMWVFQGNSLRVVPSAMSYADFVAVLLTAISALVAVVGVALAVFALWGWSQFRRGVQAKIAEITPRLLAEELRSGSTRQVLDDLVVDFFRTELENPGVAEAWAAERKRRQDELEELDQSPLED